MWVKIDIRHSYQWCSNVTSEVQNDPLCLCSLVSDDSLIYFQSFSERSVTVPLGASEIQGYLGQNRNNACWWQPGTMPSHFSWQLSLFPHIFFFHLCVLYFSHFLLISAFLHIWTKHFRSEGERINEKKKKSISVPTGLGAKTALFSFRQTHFHSHELFKSFSFDTQSNYNTHTFTAITHTGVQNNIF